MKKAIIFLSMFLIFGFTGIAQVGINADDSAPDSSAMLDVKSTTKGVLVPRMTEAERDLIANPATGLMVFCTDNNRYYFNKGTPASKNWVMMNSQWSANGTSINYSAGDVGIGTATPGGKLDVAGRIWQTSTGQSVFLGQGAGAADDLTLNQNVFVGYNSGGSNTTGQGNAANGYYALQLNTTGNWNTANGYYALQSNTLGTGNTANGYYALQSNTLGTGNTANGYEALNINTTGVDNTAIGIWALRNNQSGTTNTAIGYKANVATGNLTNATAIGANALAGANNCLVLGSISGVNEATASVNVGIGTSSPAASAALDIASTNKGFLPPRMTTADRTAIISPATGLTIYNTTKNCNETYNGSSWVSNTHYIGESYGGGKVFYVYDNGQHGLIAATADQSTGIRWYGGSYTNTRARADGVGAGLKNTSIIIANQGPVDGSAFAATLCNEYSVTVGDVTYGDWYLPSKYELNLLYLQKAVVGGFANNYYWSSSEDDAVYAWYQGFANGLQEYNTKNGTIYVRAVRAF
jgi:hypothetical protein